MDFYGVDKSWNLNIRRIEIKRISFVTMELWNENI